MTTENYAFRVAYKIHWKALAGVTLRQRTDSFPYWLHFTETPPCVLATVPYAVISSAFIVSVA